MKHRISGLLLAALLIAGGAEASWWDLFQHDARMEFDAARTAALETIVENPQGADAIAAAAWWQDNLDNIARPSEILDATQGPLSPPLAFILNHIEAELAARVPAGVPPFVEMSGPWGLFARLDLDRREIPGEIPPLGSVWTGPGSHYHLRFVNETGRVQTPPSLNFGGDALARWRLRAAADFSGWMVIEIRGNANIRVDGRDIDRIRDPAISGPGLRWYRAHFSAGFHRIEAMTAFGEGEWIRLNFIDDSGRAFSWQEADPGTGSCSPSSIQIADPLPPPEGFGFRDLLLRYQLLSWMKDPVQERKLVDEILKKWPRDPLAHLNAAAFYLLEQTGAGLNEDYQRSHAELEKSGDSPLKNMLEYLLARMQGRTEDAETLRDAVVARSGADPRVIRLKIDEALSRGWAREAEEALDELEAAVGRNQSVEMLRLQVLKSLEKWDERKALIEEMIEHSPPRTSLLEIAAESCSSELSVDLARRLETRIAHPNFDSDFIRLLMRAGLREEAERKLEEAFRKWGRIPLFQDLGLMVYEPGSGSWRDMLRDAIRLRPQDLNLRSLASRWKMVEPFWAKERVDAEDFLSKAVSPEKGVDTALLLDQAVERIFPNGASIYYYHGLTKALTPEGVSRASILQGFPGSERLQLRILKPDGRIIIPAGIKDSGTRLQIDEVEVGDVVEDEYIATISPIAPSVAGHLSTYVYRFADPERSFGLSEYELILPENLEINIDGMYEGLERTETREAGLRKIRFRAQDMPPSPGEPFGPPEQDLLPWVTYSFGLSWQDVGDSIREKMIPVLRGSPELEAFIGEKLKGDSAEAAIRNLVGALIDRVKPGRSNMNLGSSIGESFSRKEGNRLSILAGGLLDAGYGVDLLLSRPAPMAGGHLKVPSLDVFGQPLLRIHTDEGPIWVDLSENLNGVGHISPSFQNSDALVIPLGRPAEAISILEKLPEFPNPMLEDRSEIHARVAEDGSARIDFNSWVTPPSADDLKTKLDSVPPERMGAVFQRLAARYFPGASSVEGSYHRLEDGRLLITISLEDANACEAEADELSCRGLLIDEPLSPILASLPQRRSPLILQVPVEKTVDLQIEAPPGWKIKERSPRRLQSRWGELQEKLRIGDGRMDSRLSLEIFALTVAPEDYPEFSRFCRAVDELTLRPPKLRRLD